MMKTTTTTVTALSAGKSTGGGPNNNDNSNNREKSIHNVVDLLLLPDVGIHIWEYLTHTDDQRLVCTCRSLHDSAQEEEGPIDAVTKLAEELEILSLFGIGHLGSYVRSGNYEIRAVFSDDPEHPVVLSPSTLSQAADLLLEYTHLGVDFRDYLWEGSIMEDNDHLILSLDSSEEDDDAASDKEEDDSESSQEEEHERPRKRCRNEQKLRCLSQFCTSNGDYRWDRLYLVRPDRPYCADCLYGQLLLGLKFALQLNISSVNERVWGGSGNYGVKEGEETVALWSECPYSTTEELRFVGNPQPS